MPAVTRTIGAGIIVAAAVAIAGWTIERARFGATDDAAAARIAADIQRRFDDTAATLQRLAAEAAGRPDLIAAAARDTASADDLFDLLRTTLGAQDPGRTGITIYDAVATPLAWAGRVSDLPREALTGPIRTFVLAGGLGPRMVLLDSVRLPRAGGSASVATIAVERSLEDSDEAAGTDGFILTSSLAPVVLGFEHPEPPPFGFTVRTRNGETLIQAGVSADAIAEARNEERQVVIAAILSVAGITLALLTAAFIDQRRRARRVAQVLGWSLAMASLVAAARLVFWVASGRVVPTHVATDPFELFLSALAATALTWIAFHVVERRRVMKPRVPLALTDSTAAALAGAYAAAGVAGALSAIAYERLLRRVLAGTTVDVLHFSLHPVDLTRLGLAFAIVLLDACVIGIALLALRAPGAWRRMPHGRLRVLAALAWIAAAAGTVTVAERTLPGLPVAGTFVALGAAAAGALVWGRLRPHLRRGSQTLRLAAVLGALLAPSLAFYPSLLTVAGDAKEQMIANEYAPQALSQRDDLQAHVRDALDQVDRMPGLAALVTSPADVDASTTEGFVVWSQTDLQRYRLTSAVELYRVDGRLASRFALRLPEYAPGRYAATRCEWDISSDVSPIGTLESHELRATRGICDHNRIVGGIVVRAMLDYRTLPFIAAKAPYLDTTVATRQPVPEDVAGRDVEFAVYGWSRSPIFSSRSAAWPLSDATFDRLTASREPFWETVEQDSVGYRVHFFSDRGGVYALGYPVITPVGHLINLAELVTLVFVLYLALVAAAALFGAAVSHAPTSGRALLREIRSSFYRKLFLAFGVAAVAPVLILAFATRTYLAGDLNAGVEETAVKTVTIAQRLVEDYSTLQQRGTTTLQRLDDGIMELVSRAIDEDVSLFTRSRLDATSARDLFASQFLTPRTPSEVYQQIVLERAPTYVGVQEGRYLVAAAPVRTGDREAIVTVPMALRQQQIEQQIDELDRRVLFGAVLFTLLGGAFGYWMAERIADPVNRLTRATRRIASGDLDARIAASSVDELGRLVGDFNRMADDLVRQRKTLERTQRLEAWADMARQVAHDIKNPLTPIQLAAEHAHRVNRDKGAPLSPVLDECVNTILGQVRLLRQLSSEFSSFASSPTPKPELTDLAVLIEEVVAPYRMGLSDRVAIELSTPPDLPSADIDRTLFARAMTNVIENALHAMPGGGRLRIEVRLKPDTTTELFTIRISDTGVGMDHEALERIFEPYFSTKATGTGLGLTIARRNIEIIGGTIRVESQRGVGTAVTIEIPAAV